jgi:hypothetical protein
MRLRRLGDDDLLPQQLFDSGNDGGRNLDAVAENPSQLNDNDLTGDQVVLGKDMPEDVCA